MSTDAHVLVVDDDQRLRSLLQRYLAENGFRVTTAIHSIGFFMPKRGMLVSGSLASIVLFLRLAPW